MLYWCEIGNCGMGPLSDGAKALEKKNDENIRFRRKNGRMEIKMYNQPPTLLRSGDIKIKHLRNSYMIIDL